MAWVRLRALIVKELLVVLRDPESRVILVVPPLIQLLIFSFAVTLDVTRASVIVFNQDPGAWGSELVQRIAAAPTVASVLYAQRQADVRAAIDQQEAIAAVEIGPAFSREIEARSPATVQVILDGRRSNASQIVASYLGQIVNTLAVDTPAGQRAAGAGVTLVARDWFNPALLAQWAMIPGLIGIIALLTGLLVTALSVARERESGTFDQLLVSPLRPQEILLGKALPPVLISLVQVTVFILVAIWGFGLPLRGSLGLLYFGALVYLAAVVGLGLFVSALSMTQQQAILGAFLLMVPIVLLSGFATPIENMPAWLQPLTLLDPLRYFLVIVKGVFLRDLPASEVLANAAPLALIAAGTQGAAAWLFRSKLE